MIPTKYIAETVNVGHPSAVYIPGQGFVRGFRDADRSLIRFLNIPYATVTERWRQASPVKPWLGVRDATRYGYITWVFLKSVISTAAAKLTPTLN